jgi:two-component system response regulator MtrA
MKKILVVDDDEAILAVVGAILSAKGFEVLTNSTGLDIPALAKQYSPDVILLDIRLPGKSGIEVCREIKALADVPVILFSAHSDEEKALRDSGAEAFIQKPFDIKGFVSVIDLYASCRTAEVQ